MQRQTTITALLAAGADDATALHAPGGKALSYKALRAHVARTVAALNALGIGRGDRVAIVLPNGPEMASAFVAIAAGTTSAPLNPAYRADEFDVLPVADLERQGAGGRERQRLRRRSRVAHQAGHARAGDRARPTMTAGAFTARP
ncbi:MAG: AMP-binding protein [Burkholderiaceae bacterium]|nr:AMP-binding protein [Burkholderiaceae bacterium]